MTHPMSMVKDKVIKNEAYRSETQLEHDEQFLSLLGIYRVACSKSS